MKQTAVEWLMPKILELNLQLSLRRISQRNCELEILRLFEQAKQMEEEQIVNAFNQGYTQCSIEDLKHTSRDRYVDAEDYINKTFKSE